MENRRINILDPKDIIIKSDDVVTFNEYVSVEDKEPLFRDRFIRIIKANTESKEDVAIKLVDLKKKYLSMLPRKILEDKQLEQGLKNTTSSNKDNKTHLLRNICIDWYYTNNTNSKKIIVNDKLRKPAVLPEKLERSRTKKYYVFYVKDLDANNDSSVEAKESVDKSDTRIRKYETMDLNAIKKQKNDFVEKQRRDVAVGTGGEKYILNLENEILKKERINKTAFWVAEQNDSFGFDILSYRRDKNGEIKRIFLEVKSTVKGIKEPFFVTDLEMKVSKEYSNSFFLVRVYNYVDELTADYQYFSGDISKQNDIELVNSKITNTYKIK